MCSVAKRQRQSFRSVLITHTKLAFISILVLLICMLHTWLLCQCYSLSIACSCVDDSCVWVAPPAFRGAQCILTHWFILRIIEAVCLMLLHCSTSFLSHLVTDVSTVCLQCLRNVRFSRFYSVKDFFLYLLLSKDSCLKKKKKLARTRILKPQTISNFFSCNFLRSHFLMVEQIVQYLLNLSQSINSDSLKWEAEWTVF